MDPPTLAAGPGTGRDPLHPGSRAHRVRPQGLGDCDGPRLKPLIEAADPGAAGCFLGIVTGGVPASPRPQALEPAPEEAPVLPLHHLELGKDGGHRERFGVSRIDARNEGVDESGGHLGTQTAPGEGGDGLIAFFPRLLVPRPRAAEGLRQETELALGREEGGSEEPHRTGGKGDRSSVVHHVAPGPLV
jgi:hypothetical protein